MQSIAPFYVMEIQRRAIELDAAGHRVVHMEIGQPDFGAPPMVADAVVQAMRTDSLGYTDALGIRPLRQAISAFYRSRFGIDVPERRILVTAGGSGAFLIMNAALFQKGDAVLLPAPGYPCNRHFVAMFDAEPRALDVTADTAFQPTASLVDAAWTPDVRGILIATPSNPTGTTIAMSELAAIADVVRRRRGWLMVDEIYQSLGYAGAERSALELGDDLIVVNSFSKYFNLTGWRIGWMVVPDALVGPFERIAQNAFISPSAPAQRAALAALTPEAIAIFETRRAEFRRRRDFVVPALRGMGFEIPVVPEGAFYVYADCSRFADDSFAFAFDMLERAHVAFTPGRDFGGTAASRYVRFAYTQSMETLEEGMRRLARVLA